MKPSSLQDYEIAFSIGRGTTSEVFLAKHTILQTNVAIKAIPKFLIEGKLNKILLKTEIDALVKLRNPYIAPVYDIFVDEHNYYFAMHFAENGSFASMMKQGRPIPEEQARRYFGELLSALSYIHNVANLIHRDIKADNILIDANFDIKIIDFGMALTLHTQADKKTCVGSPAYMSPETILNENITEKTDIWSAGIFLFYITTGYLPFDDQDIPILFNKIVNENIKIPPHLSEDLKELLTAILTKNTDERPSIEQLLTYNWLRKAEIHIYKNDLPKAKFDLSIIEKLRQYGYSTDGIIEALDKNIFNSSTAAYRILADTSKTQTSSSRLQLASVPKFKRASKTALGFNSIPEDDQDYNQPVHYKSTDYSKTIKSKPPKESTFALPETFPEPLEQPIPIRPRNIQSFKRTKQIATPSAEKMKKTGKTSSMRKFGIRRSLPPLHLNQIH